MATIYVTTALDIVNVFDGKTSLREAVIQANSNPDRDLILFHPTLQGQTIELVNGAIQIFSNMTIDGDMLLPSDGFMGDNKADITIMGRGSQIFVMERSDIYTDVSLRSLTLTNGNGTVGGAIHAKYIDRLSIIDTTIQNSGDINGRGGAIYADNTSLRLINSLLYSNEAREGGAIFSRDSSIRIFDSTLHDNDASIRGGAIHLEQQSSPSSLLLVQSTVTGNSAASGSASTTSGGAISTISFTASNSITITNSVVAENTSGNANTLHDVAGTISTANHSVFGSDVTFTAGINNFESVTDPGLGKLWNNGGTVWTRNIEDSSSALINAGSNTGVPVTDANGAPRISDGIVDVGATEFNGPLVVTTHLDTVDAGDGLLSLREAVAIANGNSDADSITFAAGLAGKSIILTGGELAIAATVSIDGDVNGDNKADITISGNNANRIFLISGGSTVDVDLLSLNLINGKTNDRGGAIFAQTMGTLDIFDTTFSGNTAAVLGGAIAASDSDVNLTNVLITNNSSGYNGGGISLSASSYAVLVNTTVHANSAAQQGGGIAVNNSALIVRNSTVTSNHADTDGAQTNLGGGISNVAIAQISIGNSIVMDNTSGTGLASNNMRGGLFEPVQFLRFRCGPRRAGRQWRHDTDSEHPRRQCLHQLRQQHPDRGCYGRRQWQ